LWLRTTLRSHGAACADVGRALQRSVHVLERLGASPIVARILDTASQLAAMTSLDGAMLARHAMGIHHNREFADRLRWSVARARYVTYEFAWPCVV
jgi:hypothetical protein